MYVLLCIKIDFALQRLFENNPNCDVENSMIMYIISSNENEEFNNSYQIEWSVGEN